MRSAQWKEVEALFERAVVLPASERESFLQSATGNDESLRREVESMLQADAEAASGNFLDQPEEFFATNDGAQFAPGEKIDRYRIVSEIGRGGMGAVFLAERADDQFRKRVALKVIKRGMDTVAVLRRFQKERQILAEFDHPYIARLLDGGTTENGLPYFIMEYVEGLPLDEYCKTHALSISQRLKLFREICAAVSYAHRHLVVHRDIKRSNILVTSEGVPKLLDFGIAKILSEEPGLGLTVTGTRPMTPESASPEQLRGEAVTTATDVYSLGIVLYELLTEVSPFRAGTRSVREIERAVIEQVPERPSTVNTREKTGDATKLRGDTTTVVDPRLLRGDLDNIVLMALRKEPERRYSSVDQFSADIGRYLESRPVRARRDTVSYRTGKFVRRNKLALAAAALVLFSLIVGIIATTREARVAQEQRARAERRFNDVRKLANNVLFNYHDAIKALPGATKVREQLVRDAVTYLDSLASESHDDPGLQRELAAAYERVGDVRGGDTNGNLNDIAGATESYTKALRLREGLLALHPNDIEARREVAHSHQKIGFRLGQTRQAGSGMEHLDKARAIYLDLTRQEPANEELQFEFAAACYSLGRAKLDQRNLAGANEEFQVALPICEQLAEKHPLDQQFRRTLWTIEEGMADVLWLQSNFAGAIQANEKAQALGEALMAEDPLNADYRRGLALNYKNGGEYRGQDDPHGALKYFDKALQLDEELQKTDPADAQMSKDLAYLHKKIADLDANVRDNADALLHFSKARDISRKLAEDSPVDLTSQFLSLTCGAGVAGMEARLGQMEAAMDECNRGLALLQKVPNDPTNIKYRFSRAQSYEYMGYAFNELASAPKLTTDQFTLFKSRARDMFRESLEIIADLRSRGALDANSGRWVKIISNEVANCDKALTK